MKQIHMEENGMILDYEIREDGVMKFRHFSDRPLNREEFHLQNDDGFLPLELQIPGMDRPMERHGNKYIVTVPGYRMKYVSHTDTRNEKGRIVEYVLQDEETGMEARLCQQFYDGVKVIRMWNTVTNKGNQKRILEHVSSFNYLGIDKEGEKGRDEKLKIFVPHNSWQREINWETYTLPQLGYAQTQKGEVQRSSKRILVSNTGNWSAKEYLPMGLIENTDAGNVLYWQIEHNGSWKWEIGDQSGHLYLQLAGPSEREDHWYQELMPGESFETVPVAVGIAKGGFEEAMRELTCYRRLIRRKNEDNRKLRVIFNDYMNCLWGSPTTQKELPMIEAAARAGCEYYVIDAGWYSAGDWWDSVGEWKESRERFPGGLKEVMDAIRAAGMIPGVWLEIEVMGIHCPLVPEFEREGCFFIRHGEKVYDRSRFQLDFRKEKVRSYATGVIDRLVREYGVGYIKMDYNIEPGIGTETEACSVGAGLLGHERAYLSWLDDIFARYPELVIENCSSGGLRMDYAMLSRYSIQSTSDTEDYRMYATIAANAPSAVTPEQAAVWSYPLTGGTDESVIFNMVNCMLLRIHQSGHLVNMKGEQFDLIAEGIRCYKQIRELIRDGLPFWPLGYADYQDDWLSLGIERQKEAALAVWRREGKEDTVRLPLASRKGHELKVTCLYPENRPVPFVWKKEEGILEVRLEEAYMARLFWLEEI